MFKGIDDYIADVAKQYAHDTLRKKFKADGGPATVRGLIGALKARIDRLQKFET